MSTEIANIKQMPLAEVKDMAAMVAKSALFPGITTPESAATLMLLCQSEGLHPLQALKRYHIIEGRPSMRADAMQAEFQARGGRIRWMRTDALECRAIVSHPDHAPDGLELAVTFAEMQAAGVTHGYKGIKDNWRKFAPAMLRARLISMAVRMILPEIVAGIYTPEEVQDFEPARAQPAGEKIIFKAKPKIDPPAPLPEAEDAVATPVEPAKPAEPAKAAEQPQAQAPTPAQEAPAPKPERAVWSAILGPQVDLVTRYMQHKNYLPPGGTLDDMADAMKARLQRNPIAAITAASNWAASYDNKIQPQELAHAA